MNRAEQVFTTKPTLKLFHESPSEIECISRRKVKFRHYLRVPEVGLSVVARVARDVRTLGVGRPVLQQQKQLQHHEQEQQ